MSVSRTGLGFAVAAVLLAGGGAVAAPAVTAAMKLLALGRLEPGQYQVKEIGSDAPARLLCLGDAAVLIQLQHPGAACSRFVIADTTDSAVVHYTCPGAGHGRTTVSITTPRSFELQTQGIVRGAPFDLDFLARRVGTCGGADEAVR